VYQTPALEKCAMKAEKEAMKPENNPGAPPLSQSGSFFVAAPLAEVMLLFTAEGERRWVQGWDPEILSGAGERGSAFRSRDADGRATTWIVAHHDIAQGRVSYARLAEGSNIGLVEVSCSEAGAGTKVAVTYTLTAIAAAARRFVEEFLEPQRYARRMEEWQAIAAANEAANEGWPRNR
jgi:hypothetical protein